MENKTILMFSDNSVWSMSNGKGAPSFYNTIEGYCNNGYHIILIQPEYAINGENKLVNCDIISFKNSIFKKYGNIRKIGFFARIISNLHNNFMYKKIAERVIVNEKVVLIYAYEINGVKTASRISKKYKLPLITRFQGTILCDKKNNLFNKIKYHEHFSALKQKADLCIMTNDGTQGDRILRDLKNKSEQILFLRNGVNFIENSANEKIKKELKIEGKSLITVSRLEKWKRVDRAILLIKWLIQYYPNVKLIIVGDGEERTNLEKMVADYKLNENIIFVGSIKHEKVIEYMSIADVFLSFYDLSNVGNPLLEAMMLGKPIVTLDVGDTKTLITHKENGLIYKSDEIEDIHLGVKNLLDNEDFAKTLGYNAKKYAKDNFYSWDERIKIELMAVNKLLEKG